MSAALAPPDGPPGAGSITDVAGLEVGHFSDPRRPTGCSVVIAREGAVCGVDVRGGAPGTRETELLAPGNLVQQVHAVLLTGGSAFGLAAADGVVRWLEERGIGLDVRYAKVPIVPAAVLFDLSLGDARIRPDAAAGYAACDAASSATPAEGNVGAGSGALVGKLFGINNAMKGGIGNASVRIGSVTVAAMVACNALGDVYDPATARLVAGSRREDGRTLRDTRRAVLAGEAPVFPLAGTHTTLGVVATDARLDKAQAQRLAMAGHAGLARAVNPVHTMSDGDIMFALSTQRAAAPADALGLTVLCAAAAEVVARATLRAVLAATSVTVGGWHVPAARDL